MDSNDQLVIINKKNPTKLLMIYSNNIKGNYKIDKLILITTNKIK